jgi:hypothetical protein
MQNIKIGVLNKNYQFLRFKELGDLEFVKIEDVRIGDVISEINHNRVKYYLILDILLKDIFLYFEFRICEAYPNFVNLIFNK